MRILITGGCGFVGSNLAILFKESNESCEVYCFDNLSRRGSEINLQKILQAGAQFIHGDVRVRSDFERLPCVDLVIDAAAEPSVLAGKDPGELDNLIQTNLVGTINTLYFAKQHQSGIVFLSTSRVYPYNTLCAAKLSVVNNSYSFSDHQDLEGLSRKGVAENYPLEGVRSLYGVTKLASEHFIQEFASNFNIPAVINRCGVISGPYQMGKIDQGVLVLWMARHFWKGKLDYIGFGGLGQQARDILHIRDLFRLLKWQINNLKSINGQIFNVGGGLENSVSLSELTDFCVAITGNKIEIGSSLVTRPGDLPLYISDNSKITQLSGWKPEINVPTLLNEVYNWIRNDEDSLKSILSR